MVDFKRIKNSSRFKAFNHLINKQIESVSRCQYFHDNEPSEDEGELEIKFTNGMHLLFSLMTDGESIDANIEKMRIPKDDPETSSTWKRIILTDKPEYWSLIGSKIIDFQTIIDSFTNNEVITGARLVFSTGDSLLYLNSGDDAKVFVNYDSVIWSQAIGIKTRIESIK